MSEQHAATSISQADVEDIVAAVADEFVERLEAGDSPEVEDYARRYPELSEVLRRTLDALRTVHRMTPFDLTALDGEAPSGQSGRTFGDYRILGEIGRGGMGVVYEAEQLSLGRRVALKVLPMAGVLDERQLARFKNEARAAAALHHQNIVPIYGVGCERGVHYYAMQYIEGRTLAALIEELRQRPQSGQPAGSPGDVSGDRASDVEDRESPASEVASQGSECRRPFPVRTAPSEITTSPFAVLSTRRTAEGREFYRAAARIGLQVAEALDHAHELGVVHRDIKPSNLMLDERGKVWVADFGLARIEAGATLTMTGDVVGTLRYMSPEQVLGRSAVVDARTDVYSLGATLYELLTLRPVFEQTERARLMKQIAADDPLRPRRLNKAIPAELETIVLKCLARDPAERYSTAAELADDLKRFLNDEPIRATRPTLTRRCGKWSRRHKGLVASLVAVLLVAAIGSLIGAILIWREQARTSSALARAETNYREARRQRQHAEAQVRRARQALDQLLVLMAEKESGWGVLLEDALAFSRSFVRNNSDDPAVRFEAATASGRMGNVLDFLGRYSEAEEAYRQSVTLLEELVREFPGYADYLEALAKAGGDLEVLLARLGDDEEAHRVIRKIMNLTDDVLAGLPDRPAEQRSRGLCCQVRARLKARLCAWDDAAADFQGAAELLGAGAPGWFETAWWIVGPYPNDLEASFPPEQHFDPLQPVPPRGLAVPSPPQELRWRLAYREAYGALDLTKFIPGRNIAAYAQTRIFATREQEVVLLAGSDDQVRLWLNGALVHEYDRPRMCVPDSDGVLVTLRAGWNILLAKVMNEQHGGYLFTVRLSNDPVDFAWALAQHGQREIAESIVAGILAQDAGPDRLRKLVERAKHHYAESAAADETCRLAIACVEQLAARFPGRADHDRDLARLQYNLGCALRDQGQRNEAIRAFREAARLNPGEAAAHHDLGALLAQQQQWDEAASAFAEALRHKPDDPLSHFRLGQALAETDRLDEAIVTYRQALRLDPGYALREQIGDDYRASGLFDELIAARREALRRDPQSAEARFRLGVALGAKGLWDEAIAEFREALRLDPRHAAAENHLERALRPTRPGTDNRRPATDD